MTDQRAKLYVILGSHACRTGMLMLDHKRIPYDCVMVPTGLQRALPALGFPGGTVPAITFEGEKVQTNREIARFLDDRQPEPPLLPGDEAKRERVEEAERWADEVFQMAARRLALAAVMHPEASVNRGGRGRLGPLLWRRPRMRAIGVRGVSRIFDVNPEAERRLLAELPALLDRIDGWVEEGTLNGEQLNAADYAIAPSLALILYRLDVRPEFESRPASALVDRVLPEPEPEPGSTPSRAAPVGSAATVR